MPTKRTVYFGEKPYYLREPKIKDEKILQVLEDYQKKPQLLKQKSEELLKTQQELNQERENNHELEEKYQDLEFKYSQVLLDVDYQLQVHTKQENETLKQDLAD